MTKITEYKGHELFERWVIIKKKKVKFKDKDNDFLTIFEKLSFHYQIPYWTNIIEITAYKGHEPIDRYLAWLCYSEVYISVKNKNKERNKKTVQKSNSITAKEKMVQNITKN